MRTDTEKALSILEKEANEQGFEIVRHDYHDGSGYQLLFQRPDEVKTLARLPVRRGTAGEDILMEGRMSLKQAGGQA